MYQRILVPVDGSDTSQRGLAEAIGLARTTGGALHLLHVVDARLLVADAMAAPAGAMLEGWQAAGERLVADAVAQARAAGLSADGAVRIDAAQSVADIILAEVPRCGADLIVMGTHGRRGLLRVALGSDAELVLRGSPVPVLMVRPAPPAAG